MEKKIRGGKIPFFAQKYQIFSKLDLFSEKFVRRGGRCPPLPPPGYAHAYHQNEKAETVIQTNKMHWFLCERFRISNFTEKLRSLEQN